MKLRYIYIICFLALVSNQISCAVANSNATGETNWSVMIVEYAEGSRQGEYHLAQSNEEMIHLHGYPIQVCRATPSETDIERILSIQSKKYLEQVQPIDQKVHRSITSGLEFPRIEIYFSFGDKRESARYPTEAVVPSWVHGYVENVTAIVQRLCPATSHRIVSDTASRSLH